jgi:hypothetical protein
MVRVLRLTFTDYNKDVIYQKTYPTTPEAETDILRLWFAGSRTVYYDYLRRDDGTTDRVVAEVVWNCPYYTREQIVTILGDNRLEHA